MPLIDNELIKRLPLASRRGLLIQCINQNNLELFNRNALLAEWVDTLHKHGKCKGEFQYDDYDYPDLISVAAIKLLHRAHIIATFFQYRGVEQDKICEHAKLKLTMVALDYIDDIDLITSLFWQLTSKQLTKVIQVVSDRRNAIPSFDYQNEMLNKRVVNPLKKLIVAAVNIRGYVARDCISSSFRVLESVRYNSKFELLLEMNEYNRQWLIDVKFAKEIFDYYCFLYHLDKIESYTPIIIQLMKPFPINKFSLDQLNEDHIKYMVTNKELNVSNYIVEIGKTSLAKLLLCLEIVEKQENNNLKQIIKVLADSLKQFDLQLDQGLTNATQEDTPYMLLVDKVVEYGDADDCEKLINLIKSKYKIKAVFDRVIYNICSRNLDHTAKLQASSLCSDVIAEVKLDNSEHLSFSGEELLSILRTLLERCEHRVLSKLVISGFAQVGNNEFKIMLDIDNKTLSVLQIALQYGEANDVYKLLTAEYKPITKKFYVYTETVATPGKVYTITEHDKLSIQQWFIERINRNELSISGQQVAASKPFNNNSLFTFLYDEGHIILSDEYLENCSIFKLILNYIVDGETAGIDRKTVNDNKNSLEFLLSYGILPGVLQVGCKDSFVDIAKILYDEIVKPNDNEAWLTNRSVIFEFYSLLARLSLIQYIYNKQEKQFVYAYLYAQIAGNVSSVYGRFPIAKVLDVQEQSSLNYNTLPLIQQVWNINGNKERDYVFTSMLERVIDGVLVKLPENEREDVLTSIKALYENPGNGFLANSHLYHLYLLKGHGEQAIIPGTDIPYSIVTKGQGSDLTWVTKVAPENLQSLYEMYPIEGEQLYHELIKYFSIKKTHIPLSYLKLLVETAKLGLDQKYTFTVYANKRLSICEERIDGCQKATSYNIEANYLAQLIMGTEDCHKPLLCEQDLFYLTQCYPDAFCADATITSNKYSSTKRVYHRSVRSLASCYEQNSLYIPLFMMPYSPLTQDECKAHCLDLANHLYLLRSNSRRVKLEAPTALFKKLIGDNELLFDTMANSSALKKLLAVCISKNDWDMAIKLLRLGVKPDGRISLPNGCLDCLPNQLNTLTPEERKARILRDVCLYNFLNFGQENDLREMARACAYELHYRYCRQQDSLLNDILYLSYSNPNLQIILKETVSGLYKSPSKTENIRHCRALLAITKLTVIHCSSDDIKKIEQLLNKRIAELEAELQAGNSHSNSYLDKMLAIGLTIPFDNLLQYFIDAMSDSNMHPLEMVHYQNLRTTESLTTSSELTHEMTEYSAFEFEIIKSMLANKDSVFDWGIYERTIEYINQQQPDLNSIIKHIEQFIKVLTERVSLTIAGYKQYHIGMALMHLAACTCDGYLDDQSKQGTHFATVVQFCLLASTPYDESFSDFNCKYKEKYHYLTFENNPLLNSLLSEWVNRDDVTDILKSKLNDIYQSSEAMPYNFNHLQHKNILSGNEVDENMPVVKESNYNHLFDNIKMITFHGEALLHKVINAYSTTGQVIPLEILKSLVTEAGFNINQRSEFITSRDIVHADGHNEKIILVYDRVDCSYFARLLMGGNKGPLLCWGGLRYLVESGGDLSSQVAIKEPSFAKDRIDVIAGRITQVVDEEFYQQMANTTVFVLAAYYSKNYIHIYNDYLKVEYVLSEKECQQLEFLLSRHIGLLSHQFVNNDFLSYFEKSTESLILEHIPVLLFYDHLINNHDDFYQTCSSSRFLPKLLEYNASVYNFPMVNLILRYSIDPRLQCSASDERYVTEKLLQRLQLAMEANSQPNIPSSPDKNFKSNIQFKILARVALAIYLHDSGNNDTLVTAAYWCRQMDKIGKSNRSGFSLLTPDNETFVAMLSNFISRELCYVPHKKMIMVLDRLNKSINSIRKAEYSREDTKRITGQIQTEKASIENVGLCLENTKYTKIKRQLDKLFSKHGIEPVSDFHPAIYIHGSDALLYAIHQVAIHYKQTNFEVVMELLTQYSDRLNNHRRSYTDDKQFIQTSLALLEKQLAQIIEDEQQQFATATEDTEQQRPITPMHADAVLLLECCQCIRSRVLGIECIFQFQKMQFLQNMLAQELKQADSFEQLDQLMIMLEKAISAKIHYKSQLSDSDVKDLQPWDLDDSQHLYQEYKLCLDDLSEDTIPNAQNSFTKGINVIIQQLDAEQQAYQNMDALTSLNIFTRPKQPPVYVFIYKAIKYMDAESLIKAIQYNKAQVIQCMEYIEQALKGKNECETMLSQVVNSDALSNREYNPIKSKLLAIDISSLAKDGERLRVDATRITEAQKSLEKLKEEYEGEDAIHGL